MLNVKRVYASHFSVALWQPSVIYAKVNSLGLSSRALNCSHLRILRRAENQVKGSRELFPCGRLRTSYPLSKALIMLCRGEMSERISLARTVTERKVHLALREKSPRKNKPFNKQPKVAPNQTRKRSSPTVSACGNPSQKGQADYPLADCKDSVFAPRWQSPS